MSRFLFPLCVLLLAAPVAAGVVTGTWSPKGGQAGAAFGTSVAPAGDVNGDGYSDVLVGAPLFDNGQADEGRAFLFLGSANGLAANSAWTFEPNQAGAHAGAVVAPAGDMNGDGISDVVIGAPLYDRPGHVDAGAVFVFYGSAQGLHATPDDTLANDATGSRFGAAAAYAGDVNNDYYADLVIGAPGFGNGQANEGAAYLFHGRFAGFGTPALVVEGGEVDARLGEAVAGAGDVNADTYADVLLGAPGASPNAIPAAGILYLLKGSASGIDPVPLATVPGTADSLEVGGGVAGAGDVDADGYADILVGVPGESIAGPRRGGFRCYRGTSSGFDPVPLFVINGALDRGRVGAAVATAGDVDGDGYAEFAFGDPRGFPGQQGWVHLFYGGRAGTAFGSFVGGAQAYSRFGATVATAGDVDGDGMSELLVGAPDWSESGLALEGAASLFLGRPGPIVPMTPAVKTNATPNTAFGAALAIVPMITDWPSLLVSEPSWDAPGPDVGRIRRYRAGILGIGPALSFYEGGVDDGLYGEALVDAGDVDRDGIGDFVVGSPFYGGGGLVKRGRARLYLGTGVDYVLSSWAPQGTQAEEWFGITVAGRGDVNGDGYMDVAIGAPNHLGPVSRSGMVNLFLGGPGGLSAAPVWEKTGTTQNEYFGHRLAMLDFDADGYADLAVSCASSAPSGPPRVDIFYGGPAGLSTNAAFALSPSPPLNTYASTLAAVGDYDCDGVADLVVGATDEPNGRGTIFFHPGSRGRSEPQRSYRTWSPPPGQANAGSALAGGGDLDGDGRSDFVVGAPIASNGEDQEGVLYVFRGRPGNAPFMPDTLLESNVPMANLGSSLAPLADLNRDGYADIIATARAGNGAVYGWLGGGEGAFQFLRVGEAYGGSLLPPALLDSTTQVGVALSLHSAAGRVRTGVQFEIQPQGVPFTNVSNFVDAPQSYYQNGPPGPPGSLGGLVTYVRYLWPDVTYHLRGRSTSRNPYFPHSRWLTVEGRATGDFDFRTGGSNTAVPEIELGAVARLGGVAPNPSAGAVTIEFELPARVPLSVDIYDVRGRHMRSIAREASAIGRGTRSWDGRDTAGLEVPPGLYFVELRAGNAVDHARLLRLR